VDILKLSKREIEQIDRGLAITFMHMREIIKNPELLEKYTQDSTFFPVYLKEKDREALLIGVRPNKAST
jgi:hypothetical protein